MSPRPQPGLSDQLSALGDAVSALVRSEIRLARAELREGFDAARSGLAAMVVGVLLVLVALMVIAGAVVAALSLIWPVWLAAATVGGGTALCGLIVLAIGRARLRRLAPERTLREARGVVRDIRHPSHSAQETS